MVHQVRRASNASDSYSDKRTNGEGNDCHHWLQNHLHGSHALQIIAALRSACVCL